MIETEDQRRWWFATHPEYSWSRRGIRSHGGVDPEEVDKYVDEALKCEKGPVADLLKSVKRNFGTEGYHCPDDGFDRCKEERDPERVRKEDEKGLDEEPYIVFDLLTRARSITAPIQALKGLLRRVAKDQILNAVKKSGTRPPARLPPKGTPERKKIDADRVRGKEAKKREELADIQNGGTGSGVWSDEELEGIRKTGKFPTDTRWHHDPTVANRPDFAADPKVVHPLRGGTKGHLRDGHNMNWRNPIK